MEAERTGDGVNRTPRWPLFSLCQRLFDDDADRTIAPSLSRPSTSSQQSDETEDSVDSACDPLQDSWEEYDVKPAVATPSTVTESPQMRGPKRKRCDSTPTSKLIDDALKDLLSTIQTFVQTPRDKPVSRIDAFSDYLRSELHLLPPQHADFLMDAVVYKLLEVKKRVREKLNSV